MFPRDATIFKELLYIDALRGADATGICVVNTMSGATVLKENSDSGWFLRSKEYAEIEKTFSNEVKAILGHNRKGTMGGYDDEHAHPFVYDDRYVFFHNGTLLNHRAIADTEVDSDALGQLLTSCEGDVSKLSEALSRVSGAYACVWYDADKNTVYFLRNMERPLFMGQTDGGDFVYSSEAWMAQAITGRNGIKIKTTYTIEPGKLYSLVLNKGTKLTLTVEDIPKKQTKSPHNTFPGVGTATTEDNVFTKREAQRILSDIRRTDYHSFVVDDVVCAGGDNPSDKECYDWLIMGASGDFPGVVFKYLLKDKFEYETMQLYDKLAHGRLLDVKYDKTDKTITVYLQGVKFVKVLQTCH